MKASLFVMVCVAFVQYVQYVHCEDETDPTCEFGIIKDNICCSPECGECGGQGCGSRPGGGSDCCGGPIVSKGLSCEDNVAPCVIV